MGKQKHNSIRPQRRYGRRSTKARSVFRPPAHPGRWIAGGLAVIVVVVGALVWGNALKTKSDAYRADKEAGRWTLPPESVAHSPTARPDCRLLEIRPLGDVGPIVIAGSHDGVLLPLRDAAGALYYASDTATEAGLVIPAAEALLEDVERLHKRPLLATGFYHVTCFSDSGTAAEIYRRGLDLALLYEYAASGIDELLLLGLPTGTDEHDAQAVAFLEELRELLSTLPSPPAVGVALPLSAFESTDAGDETDEVPVYAGEISPGRIGRACDYLALDLRSMTAEETDALLPRLAYVYQRYGLRLLVNRDESGIAEELMAHGFVRIYEMKADEPLTP